MSNVRVIKVLNVGDKDCEHSFTCNPSSSMKIKKGKMEFTYDRICVRCLQHELIASNMVGSNTKYYKDGVEALKKLLE